LEFVTHPTNVTKRIRRCFCVIEILEVLKILVDATKIPIFPAIKTFFEKIPKTMAGFDHFLRNSP